MASFRCLVVHEGGRKVVYGAGMGGGGEGVYGGGRGCDRERERENQREGERELKIYFKASGSNCLFGATN